MGLLDSVFPKREPCSIRIKEGEDSQGRPVFCAQIFIQSIGWVYIRDGHYIASRRSDAKISRDRSEAEFQAKLTAQYHQDLDDRSRIRWK